MKKNKQKTNAHINSCSFYPDARVELAYFALQKHTWSNKPIMNTLKKSPSTRKRFENANLHLQSMRVRALSIVSRLSDVTVFSPVHTNTVKIR